MSAGAGAAVLRLLVFLLGLATGLVISVGMMSDRQWLAIVGIWVLANAIGLVGLLLYFLA